MDLLTKIKHRAEEETAMVVVAVVAEVMAMVDAQATSHSLIVVGPTDGVGTMELNALPLLKDINLKLREIIAWVEVRGT